MGRWRKVTVVTVVLADNHKAPLTLMGNVPTNISKTTKATHRYPSTRTAVDTTNIKIEITSRIKQKLQKNGKYYMYGLPSDSFNHGCIAGSYHIYATRGTTRSCRQQCSNYGQQRERLSWYLKNRGLQGPFPDCFGALPPYDPKTYKLGNQSIK